MVLSIVLVRKYGSTYYVGSCMSRNFMKGVVKERWKKFARATPALVT